MLLATLFLSSPSEAKKRKKETFEGSSEVTVVEVPVNVTNRQGEPIRDLSAADFELYDQGQRQDITDFEIIDLKDLNPQSLLEERQMETDLGESGRRHFLLFFDFSFSSPTAVVKAQRAAEEFVLNSLHPTDLAGIAIYTLERGPQLLVTFTPDRAQLARALNSFGTPQMLGYARSDPLRFMLANPTEGGGALSSGGRLDSSAPNVTFGQEGPLLTNLAIFAKQIDKSNKAYEGSRITAWSSAMKDLARILASVKGRKHILYFSEGFDGRLLLGREPDPEDPQVQQDALNIQFGSHWMVNSDDIYGNASLQGDVDRMLEEFRRADCVIQALDIGGLGDDSVADRRAGKVGRDALFYIADSTGGDLYENANDFVGQLDKALERTSLTYLLSFQPKGLASDGSYRRLKIKLKGPKARLSHRAGYYAPRPFQDLHPLEKSLLASNAIASATAQTDIGLKVLAAPFRANDHRAYLPVIIEAQGKDLLAGWQSNRLDVEIYAYATTLQGEMRGFFSDRVGIHLDQARTSLEEQGLKYYGHLDLSPGEYLLRVLVRNAGNGRTGVSLSPLSIPAFGETPLVVLPPFFVEEDPDWILVRHQGEQTQRDTIVYPFTLEGDPYVPAAAPVLSRKKLANLCLVTYNLGQEPTILGQVIDTEGRALPEARVEVIERTVTGIIGLDRHRLSLQTRDLPSGAYTLQVAVTDQGTGKTETSAIPFSVFN
jgi:VWFA-related protein